MPQVSGQNTRKGATKAYLVLLVAFQQSFCSGDVLSQLVRRDDSLHIMDPGHKVPEISQEAVKQVRFVQATPSLLSLQADRSISTRHT